MFKMCKIENAAGFIMLVILAVMDIRKRKIPLWLMVILLLAAGGYRLFIHADAVWQYFGGMLVGILFIGISFITHQAIGYGDSWLIMILGIYLGLWYVTTLLMGAFLLAAVFSMGILARQYFLAGRDKSKERQQKAIPFIPMLALGYIGVMLL